MFAQRNDLNEMAELGFKLGKARGYKEGVEDTEKKYEKIARQHRRLLKQLKKSPQ